SESDAVEPVSDTVRPSAGWSALPPIQRVTAGAAGPVAESGFGGRLTTWQDPSFRGTLSHAVLDGAPGGLVKGVLTASAKPSSGLELPSLTLPVVAYGETADLAAGALPVQRAVQG
ncbi:hypothetical protein VR46_42365, partial [Streptomyces sp. NRRL S-444]